MQVVDTTGVMQLQFVIQERLKKEQTIFQEWLSVVIMQSKFARVAEQEEERDTFS